MGFTFGAEFLRLGRWQEFIARCDKAMNAAQLTPQFKALKKSEQDDVYFYLGLAYRQIGMPEKAIENFSTLIERSLSHSGAYYFRGNAFLAVNNVSDAFKDHRQLVSLVVDQRMPVIVLFSHMAIFEMAKYDLEKAVNKYTDNSIAHFCRGIARERVRDLANAIDDYRAARWNLSLWHYCTEEINKAKKDMTQVESYDKDLIRPDVEYCKVKYESYTDPPTLFVEFYDSNRYDSQYTENLELERELKSAGWKQMHIWAHIEGHTAYYQRRKPIL